MITIGIDPGHGGKNHGTKSGLVEKTTNLLLAYMLVNSLKDLPFRVVMLRNCDKSMSLKERGSRSRQLGCDFVLSIHVNAIHVEDIHGAECYFQHKNTTGIMVSEKIIEEMPDELKPGRVVDGYDDPFKKGDEWLSAPENVLDQYEWAVLAEVGYATNHNDLSFIGSNDGKEKIVNALREGVLLAYEILKNNRSEKC